MQFHYPEDTQNAFQEKEESSSVESAISPPITKPLPPSQNSHLFGVKSKVSFISKSSFDAKSQDQFY